MRKTKIVCTLGPASASEEVMEAMLYAGMNVARLNFSHGTHEGHGKTIDTFRKVRDKIGVAAAVMLDTKGPEIRTGDFEGGKIMLNVREYDKLVQCVVSDTGIGIPEEHHAHIFERFYRVDKSHSRQTGGTGLGLSIVKHIAQIHHAELALVSEPGKGTTITICFTK